MILFLFSLFLYCSAEIRDGEKIINGKPIDIKDAPYQAWMGICGAAIISPQYLLTAAHCLKYGVRGVGVGSSKLRELKVHWAESYKIHENYSLIADGEYAVFDIGYIKLFRPLVFSDKVNMIELTEEEPEDRAPALATGWGATEKGNISPYLMSIDGFIVNKKECYERYNNTDFKNSVICTDHKDPGHHVYSGDSGGPLVVNNKLVGLVSFGIDRENNLCGYSDISMLRGWIKKHTGV